MLRQSRATTEALELITETYEQRIASGQDVDVSALTQLNNTLKGLRKDLGLRPTARPVKRLHEHLNGTVKAVSA